MQEVKEKKTTLKGIIEKLKKAAQPVADTTARAVKSYKAPTPDKWVKIGDTLMDISLIVSAITAFTTSPWITFAALALGKLGKIITRFAS